ncbi:hypothetical protein M0G43_12765 [Subsaxibacter sp. CAU 1640]|uniref:RipA family octameric membrane protein n=1 Tax=Subsaxibacter sp. CAU 1640 TaxID=2933271 RepID=UPI002003DEDC|nr:hypothetical protein [Subsaxibacter sp. CAU 1640]MCK7591451.1 hypothetical protein [Subsaxibacter sp. CAU 1640]
MKKKVIKYIKMFWEFAFTKDTEEMHQMSEDEYKAVFIKDRTIEQIKETYNKSWAAKNFEIELYWKRANYFWAFQIASFAGYFSIIGSNAYTTNPEVLYFVVCIGFITSIAWVFTNKGSKTWQRHWEIHVDMLEDMISGPLYKSVTSPKSFSVSKINEIVSRFISTIWILLAIKYFLEHLTFNYTGWRNVNIQVWLSSLSVLYFTCAMITGYGRGRFGERKVIFYKRKFKVISPSN